MCQIFVRFFIFHLGSVCQCIYPLGMSAPKQPKHQAIHDALRTRIATGVYAPGDQLPTEWALVEEFGASRPTVSRAVAELERNGMVERRRGAGTFVRDQGKTTSLFGLLIPGLGETEIFEPLCGGIAGAAQEHGDSVLWGGGGLSKPAVRAARGPIAIQTCESFIKHGVTGVFFAPLELDDHQDEINHRIIDLLDGAGVKVVLLDRDYLPYPQRSNFDLVGIDNRRVGYVVTRHLIERGCERVAFVARPKSASTIQARIAGYAEAMLGAGLDYDADRVIFMDPGDHEAVRLSLLGQGIDGVVCGNDVTAARLMHTLDEIGAIVPRDLLVAGIDDVRYASLLRVPLTTVSQPCQSIGQTAYLAMKDRTAKPDLPPRDLLLQCSLVVRESTQRASNRSRKVRTP